MTLTDADRALIETWFDHATSLLAMASTHSMTVVDLATWANQPHIQDRITAIEAVAQRRAHSLITASQEQALATLLRVTSTESASPETKRKAASAITRAAKQPGPARSSARVLGPAQQAKQRGGSAPLQSPTIPRPPDAPPLSAVQQSPMLTIPAHRTALVASWLVTVLASLALLVGCAARPNFTEPPPEMLIAAAPHLAASSQALVVLGEGTSHRVQVWLLERDASLVNGATCTGFRADAAHTLTGNWTIAIGPLSGVIGERGFAPPGQKREGDHRSPTGTFTITEAFGTDPTSPTKLPYRVLADHDAWCEDPASPNYNQWIVLSPDDLTTDRLKRNDDLYRHAAVIDYNRWPTIPGAGSAIFLHRADPDGAGTLGCVGLTDADLQTVLGRLHPARKPSITTGTRAQYAESLYP